MRSIAETSRVVARSESRTLRRSKVLALLVAIFVACCVAVTGGGARLDDQYRLLRDGARPQPASGNIVIVEIDARSLQSVSDWPWPRRMHARLVDALRERGAGMIAFDVDFSATTQPADDQALAAALKRAGGSVVLPTFRQPMSQGDRRSSENMPIAPLRQHAFLGSVNVQPDADGQLRQYSYGTVTAGTPRPSIAALLAGTQGNIGKSFRIDTAIDPASIARVSAIDVLAGKAPPLNERAVVVGATAIEMGDRYVVPGHGVLPGVIVQALAAETLIAGTTNPDLGPWPALLFAALAMVAGLRTKRRFAWTLGTLALLLVAPLALEAIRVASLQVVPALVLIAVDTAVAGAVALQHKLRESRLTDAVTGLPNARALEQLCRARSHVAVTVVRLSQFDEIAAVLNASDQAHLLTQVINRFAVAFPAAQIHAIEAGILGWAGSDPTDARDADAAAALFRAPITLANRAVLVSPVFGVSHGDGRKTAQLIARANIAARDAQAAGQRWACEGLSQSSDADRAIALIADLEDAVARGDIHVLYQAKFDLAKNRITGAEALVRWQHPLFGALSPDAFIPVLETNGQMRLLTLAVVDTCIAQLTEWRSRDLGLAINLSARLLDDRMFIDAITQRLGAIGDQASRITLEVTESATVASTETAIAALTEFRSFGARVSIDDYGTGQATLAYLKSFPADEIKIDKSFVTNLVDNASDRIVVRSTIELAHQLGFSVVAEGVEDEACLSCLRDYGCDTIQGWAIGKPMRGPALIAAIDAAALRRAA